MRVVEEGVGDGFVWVVRAGGESGGGEEGVCGGGCVVEDVDPEFGWEARREWGLRAST